MLIIDGFFRTSTCSTKPIYQISGVFDIEFEKSTRMTRKVEIAEAFAKDLEELLGKYGHTGTLVEFESGKKVELPF
ncbi:hypothetical protein [Lacihabitans soyangensis]|uniref:Uncharacterized protein n=1 Tax=Lacihabitans soyangensis TaxID=869394 RepID=A0AAE3KTX1_9BACT|nr:hypothetical protein [Lacihabitans soyangensis]MCP9764483.1 hypothetical protein [Lacihabitans soyangensis]